MSGIDPYAPPQSEVELDHEREVWRDGRFVVHEAGTPWPDRCYRCNLPVDREGRHGSRSVHKLFWIHPGLALIVIVALIIPPIGLLLLFLWRRRVVIDHALCHRHWWIRALLAAAAVVLLLASWILPFWLMRADYFGPALGSIELGAFLAALVILLFRRWRYGLRIRRIRDGLVWVKGAGWPFLDSLASYLDSPPP